jgi:hypothetical protein
MPQHRTRNMASDADFNHVMNEILCQAQDSALSKSLANEGIKDVGAIITLSDESIERLNFPDTSADAFTRIKLGEGDKHLIRYFSAFISWKINVGHPVHGDLQNLATRADFQEFRMSKRAEFLAIWYVVPMNQASGVTAVAPTISVPQVRDRVADFKRGIRRVRQLLLS